MRASNENDLRQSDVGSNCARAIRSVAALAFATASSAAMADPSVQDVMAKIDALQAQIETLKSSIGTIEADRSRLRKRLQTVEKQRTLPVADAGRQPGDGRAASQADFVPNAAAIAGPKPISNYNGKSLQLGGITITPGGFVAAESVFRSRTTQSDMNSSWTSIPTRNNPLASTNEERFSARQTRVGALIEGDIAPDLRGAGYFEFDFLGAAHNASPNATNGYQPRIRNLYATVDYNAFGLHLLAGQTWSLVTMNSKGITPRNEVTPPVIDATFLPGFAYARQPGVRIVKDFDDQKLWLGLSLEGSQTTFQGCTAGASSTVAGTAPVNLPGIANVTCQAADTGGGFDTTNSFSLNHSPDVVGKIAYEYTIRRPRHSHRSVRALSQFLRSRCLRFGGQSACHDVC